MLLEGKMRKAALILILCLLLSLPLLAQQPLTYGQPVTGNLTGTTTEQTWTLDAETADRITIEVERTDGNLIPTLFLRDANGADLVQSYGADETEARAVIEDFTLPDAGTYEVVVGREVEETEGGYSLTLTLVASAAEGAENASEIESIVYNEPFENTITPDHWYHRYNLQTDAADAIRIDVERLNGTLVPQIELLDASGQPLQTGYASSSNDTASLNATLPAPGSYTVVITRERGFNGATTGEYSAQVTLVGAGEGSALLDEVQGNITYDTPVLGTLADGQYYQDWLLTATAGDTITITAQRPLDAMSGASNLEPIVILLGGSNQELRRGYADQTGATAVIERMELPVPGNYIVRVTRSGEQTGATGGDYILTVSLDGTGEGSPALAEPAGTVEFPGSVEGEITNQAWMQRWAFEAAAGKTYTIEVERTEGTLVPQLVITDSNGQEMRSVYPEVTFDRALITFNFPSSGRYYLVVQRLNGQNGYTQGGYTLTVGEQAQ
jgi:hypothetical protein